MTAVEELDHSSASTLPSALDATINQALVQPNEIQEKGGIGHNLTEHVKPDESADDDDDDDEEDDDDDDDEEDDDLTSPSQTNKWSKNGFGATCPVRNGGKFTQAESEIVCRTIKEFCTKRKIKVSRLCSECDHKAELKGAWMEIARCLPHRSVQSVYRHGIRQMHPFKRGAWSAAEAAKLADLVQRMGKKWSSIQSKLNRSADSCRDKYREMNNQYVKGRWTDAETELLKKYIRQQLQAPPNADMLSLGRVVQEQNLKISWNSISKQMGRRSRLSCFKKWQKLTCEDEALAAAKEDGTATAAKIDNAKDSGETGKGDSSENLNANRKASETQTTSKDDKGEEPPLKRPKVEQGHSSNHSTSANAATEFDMYSAKMAAETVEAVELPDTSALGTAVVSRKCDSGGATRPDL